MKEKLIYVSPYPESLIGIEAKLQAQANALSQVYSVAFAHLVPSGTNPVKRTIGRIMKEFTCALALGFKRTVIYYRYCPLNIIFNCWLFPLSFFKKVWVELNTCYHEELKSEHWVLGVLHRLSMAALKRSNVIFLPVTGEIAQMEELPRGRYALLPNGVNDSGLRTDTILREQVKKILDELNEQREKGCKVLVFSASNVERWHGLDRIADLCLLLENTFLAVFGHVPEVPGALLNLEQQGGAKQYGEVTPRELEAIYEHCDFGLASFGLDRIKFTQGSPLKTRGYLSAGVRVIANHFDCVLHDTWAQDHFFRVEDDNISDLKAFIEAAYDRSELRQMAREKLSWYTIFKNAGVFEPKILI